MTLAFSLLTVGMVKRFFSVPILCFLPGTTPCRQRSVVKVGSSVINPVEPVMWEGLKSTNALTRVI